MLGSVCREEEDVVVKAVEVEEEELECVTII